MARVVLSLILDTGDEAGQLYLARLRARSSSTSSAQRFAAYETALERLPRRARPAPCTWSTTSILRTVVRLSPRQPRRRTDDCGHPDREADQVRTASIAASSTSTSIVNEGEAFGFLGPNGAGKTTMIRTLLDHLRPTSGRARSLRHRHDRRPGRDPPPARLPARRVHAVRQADRRPDDRLLRQPARRHRPAYQKRAGRAPRRSTRRASSASTRRATSRRSAWSSPLQHRPDLLLLDEPTSRPRPARSSRVLRGHPRGQGRGPHRLPVSAHPVRGREDVRPRSDHPRRPSWRGSTGPRRCATSPTTRSSSSSPARCRRRGVRGDSPA